MENERKIYTIAFEGMHRTGKGTQINILEGKLKEANIPFVSIKGAGSRTGTGDVAGNPESKYWKDIDNILHQHEAPTSVWDEASYRLAREFIVWRDRVLKNEIESTLAPFGVLIVDRSIISNASLRVEDINKDLRNITEDDIYPKSVQNKKKIGLQDVLPDIIFELIAPKDVLISRLDQEDPKYKFRKQNIQDKYDYYIGLKQLLPEEIQQKIVTIDTSEPTEKVYEKIADVLSRKFGAFRNVKK